MKKLLTFAVAAMAFAIPASASADVFTHEGLPIETPEVVTVSFHGPAGFTVNGTNKGVHCETLTVSVELEGHGTGTVETFDTAGCTDTPNGLVAHATPIGLHGETEGGTKTWTVHAEPANSRIRIEDIHINNKITLGGMVVGESTLEGDITAAVKGSNETITGVTLSGVNLFADGNAASASGTLDLEDHPGTDIGIE